MGRGLRNPLSETGIGTRFRVTKTLSSAALITTGGVDLTGASSGALKVEDVVVRTAAVAIGGATNIQIDTSNTTGSTTIYATTATSLSNAKTVDLANATATKIKMALDSGKKLTIKATGADATGTGAVTVDIEFIRLDDGATVVAS